MIRMPHPNAKPLSAFSLGEEILAANHANHANDFS